MGSVSTAPDARSCAEEIRGDPADDDGGVEKAEDGAENDSETVRDAEEDANEDEE